jgi:putative colanic acid biosysnthesis UDP-glucose lipid carrier transferase
LKVKLTTKIKKYSRLIRPIIVVFDIIIITSVLYYFSDQGYLNSEFLIYINLVWLFIAYFTKFYNVYRYTHIARLVTYLLSQFSIFILAFFAYFSIFREGEVINEQFNIILSFTLLITFFKLFFFFILKSYRLSGKNYRNVIVFGSSKSAKNVIDLFKSKQDLGYRFFGFFADKKDVSDKYLGDINAGLIYASKEQIDEVYCESDSITKQKLRVIRNYCSKNNVDFNLIPEEKDIYSKDLKLTHYGTIPILKPKKLPFEKIETHILKRCFDIFFSLLVCVFLLSWLLPILWIVVKLNSKGKFLFKQLRDGADGNQFYCYKIRSMKVNTLADKIATTINDDRITSVGAFLRKTSLDELPQFFNVLKGDMSIVGPRPHMNVQTKKYLVEIENYLFRNSVKPGITGLAQVYGYRGEIKKKSDIDHRVKLDVFYIENWSFFLDIKIIGLTILNVFKGQDKAY